MMTIRARDLFEGYYIWFNNTALLLKSVKTSPRGKILTNVKHFEPDQKVSVLTFEEAASFRKAYSKYHDEHFGDKYARFTHVITDGKIEFSVLYDAEAKRKDEESARQQAALNIKLKCEKALTVGELMDYLSGFDRKDKVKFDDGGYFEYLDKDFNWLLDVEKASEKKLTSLVKTPNLSSSNKTL